MRIGVVVEGGYVQLPFLKDNAVLEVDTQHDVVTFVFAPNILAVTIVSNTVHEKTTLLKIQPVPQISTI
jgi:hypothetical protein